MPDPESELARLQARLQARQYVADRTIVLPLYLATTLGKPLLVEGPAGVGKTEIAKVLALALDTDLIRLQCYEGLDTHTALYEWNYQRQLLHLKLAEQDPRPAADREADLFSERFLLQRPLLQALTRPRSPVLLIDELDRADEAFESFLLELLSEWQITIPEIGPIRAAHPPHVILTGNRTRELSDALRRRCFYLWIDYPDFDKELAIVRQKVPGIDAALAAQLCRFMEAVRRERLAKVPGVAETLDWARALAALHQHHLDAALVRDTLGIVFKDVADVRYMHDNLAGFLERVGVTPKLTG